MFFGTKRFSTLVSLTHPPPKLSTPPPEIRISLRFLIKGTPNGLFLVDWPWRVWSIFVKKTSQKSPRFSPTSLRLAPSGVLCRHCVQAVKIQAAENRCWWVILLSSWWKMRRGKLREDCEEHPPLKSRLFFGSESNRNLSSWLVNQPPPKYPLRNKA